MFGLRNTTSGNAMNDKEKLRMAKNLVKANNKTIKNAVRIIDGSIEEYTELRREHIGLAFNEYNQEYTTALSRMISRLQEIRDKLI